MQHKEYIIDGDRVDEQRILEQKKKTNQLLKLLVEIYDQKNLAIRLAAPDINLPVSREKINQWKKAPDKSDIIFSEQAMEHIRAALLPARPAHWDNPDFTFIDLFAGIGGLRKGFEDIGGKCVFTSEWERQARRTYLANHFVDEEELPYFLNEENDPHPYSGESWQANNSMMDITRVTLSGDHRFNADEKQRNILRRIPEHDVLLAGFPCQPFSLAGVSKKNSLGRSHGFECDTQGTLFFDVEKIIEARQPKFFVLENVKNLKSHDKGNTFATIIRALDAQGYHVLNVTTEGNDIEEAIGVVRKRKNDPTIIDGVRFTPQHRERVVLVGIRRDILNAELEQLSLGNIPVPEQRYTVRDILVDLSEEDTARYTLTENLWNYLYHYALKHQTKGNGFGFGLVDPTDPDAVTRTLSARYYKDGSEILINQHGLTPEYLQRNREHGIRKNADRAEAATAFAEEQAADNPAFTDAEYKAWIKEGEKRYDEEHGRYAPEFDASWRTPRRLTPQECARLMGFEKPEHDREDADTDFRIVCADNNAYKQFGNSVVVPVFRAVAQLLAPHIRQAVNNNGREAGDAA
ncbi:DNA (cytosine-5-)-methyltransferase [Veronia nyctiphanis]|uniref:Cytosine-specific methyltransferase n=1 Tax=Veronia nyctiphanis TaxID=1278244 RepID=A0A4Q0YMG3_9GAMM|nr:DNA (cytosine-5-)-methyltransferase [Veronia nyctiphanis]RXJ72030.1 DNA (cytosine-5-)-methyltransferase [Veronia nyctiphanis]RXJ72077.1 DNA (cytosine-5-)-methyltransferase [Veronia nyctiphanis]